MVIAIGLVILGLALLVAGGESLLRGAVGVAQLMRLTPAVIGLTVVAAGTSIPELAVGSIATFQGKTELAVGNVVGSNIFNILIILGLSALLRPLMITGNTIRLEYPVLALVTLLSVAICDDGHINRLDGVLLLCIYVGFTAYLVSLVREQLSAKEVQALHGEVEEISDDKPVKTWLSIVYIIAGVALLAGGAQATVSGAVSLAKLFGISDRVIGLTIVAGGTGLPEVVTSLVSTYRGRGDVAIGNVIGSNLFNMLVVLGLNGLIAPLPVPAATIASDNWWMLGATLLMFPVIFTGRRVSRWEGFLLLAFYALYLGVLLSLPAGDP
jgi:cation:H+ antiporter